MIPAQKKTLTNHLLDLVCKLTLVGFFFLHLSLEYNACLNTLKGIENASIIYIFFPLAMPYSAKWINTITQINTTVLVGIKVRWQQ